MFYRMIIFPQECHDTQYSFSNQILSDTLEDELSEILWNNLSSSYYHLYFSKRARCTVPADGLTLLHKFEISWLLKNSAQVCNHGTLANVI